MLSIAFVAIHDHVTYHASVYVAIEKREDFVIDRKIQSEGSFSSLHVKIFVLRCIAHEGSNTLVKD